MPPVATLDRQLVVNAGVVPWRTCCNASVQVFVASQLVVVHLRWFQEATNLHSAFPFLFLRLDRGLLTFFGKEFGIVAREFLQRDEEIAQNYLESGEIRICGKEPVDEGTDLCPIKMVREDLGRYGKSLRLQVRECRCKKVPNKVTQELPVRSARRSHVWGGVDWTLQFVRIDKPEHLC